jgi:hypothetical protein
MRILLLAIAALVLGVTVGVGMTAWELLRTRDDFGWVDPHGPIYDSPFPTIPRDSPQRPRVIVQNGEEHDFGVMDIDANGSHKFVLGNMGQGPLLLAVGTTTCRCTAGDLSAERVGPNESATVTIRWEPDGALEKFQQSANILTNDPDRPVVKLTIRGWVTQRLRAEPPSIILGGVTADQGRTVQFHLFSYYDDQFEIVDYRWADPETADNFAARWEPLTADEVAAEPHAKAGKRVLVTLKPGLPLGDINQTIRLTTDLAEASPVEVPIHANIASDVSIVGSSRVWDAERGLLTLGVLKTSQEKTVQLFVMVRGPQRSEVKLTVGQVVPDVLDAQFERERARIQGNAIGHPLVITVPRGSRPVSFLGPTRETLGKIVVETTHPQAPKVPIYVRFAVQ